MSSRRTFLSKLAGGAAVTVAGLASRSVLGANDRVRFGLIGAGSRGQKILGFALKCPNVEVVAVADAYTRRLDEAKAIAPAVQVYQDFRQLLDDKSIDAVLIASPQHLHALHFVPAIRAGKDVYQEKTMAFTPDHAKRMRKALAGSGRVVQIGMQMNSGPGIRKVQEYLGSDQLGTITAIEAQHFRNEPYGGWLRKMPPDCDLAHVDWNAFQGEARRYAFDPERYVNWRFFWDYSGGNVFENMVHQVGFWYQVLNLKIPQSVTMAGGNFRCPKMEVPDTMTVSMVQTEKLLFTWNSMFGNAFFGEKHDYLLGTNGTVMHDAAERVVFVPNGKEAPAAGQKRGELPEGAIEPKGSGDSSQKHMENFFDCVRSRKEPNCPFEIGFRAAIVCQMAIASYRRQRTVRWDPQSEDIV